MIDLTEDKRLMALSLWLGSFWVHTYSDLVGVGYYGGRSRSQSWLSRLRSALPAPTNGRSCCKMLDKLCSLGSALPNRTSPTM